MSNGGDAQKTAETSLFEEVARERVQTRHVMAWFVTVFVFLGLVVVALMLLAGVTVLNQMRGVLDTVRSVEDSISVYSVQLHGATNRFADLERTQLNLLSRINAMQAAQSEAMEQVADEVRRHGRWIDSRELANERDKRHLNAQLLVLGEDMARTEVALEQVRRRLESFVKADGVVVVGGADVPEDQDQSRPADKKKPHPEGPMPDVFSAVAIDEIFKAVLKEVALPVRDLSVPTTVSVVSFPNGDRYEGAFRSGLMHGWGVYINKMGDRFEGLFENDIRQGPGSLTTTSGERFTGTYVNGIRHGLGSLTRGDGSRYAGEFRNDLINGRGVMFYPDGSKYAGEFLNGQRHGQGVMRFANGDVYEGEFRTDQRTGIGEYSFTDGSHYRGSFVDGVRHGMGHYTFADGAQYIGPFRDGRMHGEGVRVYADGQRVKGLWGEGEHLRDFY